MSAGNDDLDLDMELAMAETRSQQQRGELIHAFPIQTTEIERQAATPTLADGPGFGSGITLSHSGDYIVVDNEAHSVKVFDALGKFRSVFGEARLTSPWDVFLTNSGNIVVSDPPCGDVKVFSPTGAFLKASEFGFHLQDPYGIAYHPVTKELAVCDRSSACVFVHDPRGVVTDIVTWPPAAQVVREPGEEEEEEEEAAEKGVVEERGEGEEQEEEGEEQEEEKGGQKEGETEQREPKMVTPAYVTYDKDHTLYVSDSDAHRLFVFDKDGRLKYTYGGEGEADGQLKHPAGVCLDREGNVLLADSGNCRVALLDPSGRLIRYALTWEDGLAEPQAVLVDNDNHLVVTEGSTGLVKVYDYVGAA